MKSALLTSVFICVFSGHALAADMIEPIVAAPYNWTGGYIGAQLGYAWASSRFENSWTDYSDLDPRGGFGGIYGGYNYQFPNYVVIGLDADINAADIRRHSDYYLSGVLAETYAMSSKIKWTGAIRARLGYAVDRFLPYIAGGYSAAEFEVRLHDGFLNREVSQKDTRSGWNIGAGLDWAATDNVILRAEYRFTDYSKKNFDDFWGKEDGWSRIKLRTNDIRLGIAYKF